MANAGQEFYLSIFHWESERRFYCTELHPSMYNKTVPHIIFARRAQNTLYKVIRQSEIKLFVRLPVSSAVSKNPCSSSSNCFMFGVHTHRTMSLKGIIWIFLDLGKRLMCWNFILICFACNLDKDERKHYENWVEICGRPTKQNVLSLPCHLNPIILAIKYVSILTEWRERENTWFHQCFRSRLELRST